MVKMIFSDFDHTMLQVHSEKNIFDEYQFDILKRIREKGISFSIVTGRCVYFFLDRFPEILEYVDYIIASNGAVIYDVKKKTFVYKKVLKNNCLKKIVDYCLDNHYELLLNCLERQYSKIEKMDQYFDFYDIDCEQVVIKFRVQDLESVLNVVNVMGDIVVNNVSIREDDVAIDIDSEGVSKGNSIIWLCKKLGVSLKETIGFGDAENDLSVFDVVGRSVAVANASENIQKKCDDVALMCSEDGIFHYIEDNILR